MSELEEFKAKLEASEKAVRKALESHYQTRRRLGFVETELHETQQLLTNETAIARGFKRKLEASEKACAEMTTALKRALETLHMQEYRQTEEFHIAPPTAHYIWENTKAKISDALSSGAGTGYIHRSELEKVEKQAAEMRETLEVAERHMTIWQHGCICRCPVTDGHSGDCPILKALSDDAGKDYVHKSEVEKACAAWRSVVNDYAGHYNTCCTSESDNDDDCACGYSKAWDSARGKT